MTKPRQVYTCGRSGEGYAAEPLHYVMCGLDNVWLANGFTREEYDGEEYVSIQNVDGLWRAIGISLATEQNELSPQEIKFLRRHMQLTQDELAKKLNVDMQTVARWEKDQTQIPGPADLAIRTLFLTSPRAQPDGASIITRMFQIIEDRAKQGVGGRSCLSIEMIQTHDEWEANVTDERQYAMRV